MLYWRKSEGEGRRLGEGSVGYVASWPRGKPGAGGAGDDVVEVVDDGRRGAPSSAVEGGWCVGQGGRRSPEGGGDG